MIVRNDSIVEASINQLPDYTVLYDAVFPKLLNLYPNATAAWSLRQLSTTYTGNLILVRRASDDTEQGFGYDSNGDLDIAGLQSFCSGTDGYVKTWYDQSGNAKHATQTTNSLQAQIVSSGSAITLGGKVCIDHSATLDMSQYTIAGGGVDFKNIALVAAQINLAGTVPYFLYSEATGGFYLTLGSGVGGPGAFGGYDLTNIGFFGSSTDTDRHLNWAQMKSSKLYIGRDGSAEGDKGTFATTMSATTLFGRNLGPSGNFQSKGKFQELVLWNTDQTSNKTGIETNINDYWTVY